MSRIRVVVADDHRLFLEGVRETLARAGDVDVVGEAESGRELLGLLGTLRPDLVLLDVRMPQLDGIACLDSIRARHPGTRVIVLSGFRDPALIESTLRRGASAYILKTIDPDDLVPVIRQVVGGTVFQALPGNERAAAHGDLTERETAILAAVARGLSNQAIAKEMWVTPQTVKFHLRNVYRKLGVANRTEAARYAYQHGLAENPAFAAAAAG